MPDSPSARRLLSEAIRRDGEEPPIVAFERYLRDVENGPESKARHARLQRSAARPFNPWRDGPAIGLSVVALLLVAAQVARRMGWI